MAVGALSGTLNLAHSFPAAGGDTATGEITNYSKQRSLWKSGTIRIRITSWPTSGAAGKAKALKFRLRTPGGTVKTQWVTIARGSTGWRSFTVPITGSTTIPAGWFCITGRAVGSCNYVPYMGGTVYPDPPHEFTWNGQIEYIPTPPLAP